MTRGEYLYREFLKNFPNFESMVKQYERNGKNSILIETIIGKKFIFKINDDGIELSPA